MSQVQEAAARQHAPQTAVSYGKNNPPVGAPSLMQQQQMQLRQRLPLQLAQQQQQQQQGGRMQLPGMPDWGNR